MVSMKDSALQLMGMTLFQKFGPAKEPNDDNLWINGDTVTIDEIPGEWMGRPGNFFTINFEDMDGDAFTLKCIDLSNKIGCNVRIRDKYLFSGGEPIFSCNGSDKGSLPLPDAGDAFDVEVSKPQDADAAGDTGAELLDAASDIIADTIADAIEDTINDVFSDAVTETIGDAIGDTIGEIFDALDGAKETVQEIVAETLTDLPSPVDTTPVDTTPVDTAPADTAPADTALADTPLADTLLVDTPAADTPLEDAPTEVADTEVDGVTDGVVPTDTAVETGLFDMSAFDIPSDLPDYPMPDLLLEGLLFTVDPTSESGSCWEADCENTSATLEMAAVFELNASMFLDPDYEFVPDWALPDVVFLKVDGKATPANLETYTENTYSQYTKIIPLDIKPGDSAIWSIQLYREDEGALIGTPEEVGTIQVNTQINFSTCTLDGAYPQNLPTCDLDYIITINTDDCVYKLDETDPTPQTPECAGQNP